MPETVVEGLNGDQIRFASFQELGELFLDLAKTEKSWNMPRLELYQHVYIAVRFEIFPQHGAEEGQTTNVVMAAELGKLVALDSDLCGHGFIVSLSLSTVG